MLPDSAASEIDRGSCFSFSLPLAPARMAIDPACVASSTDRDLKTSALRILAAEDNAVNRLVLKTLLEQAGLDPVIVCNGEDAVTAWEQGGWDVILMDVQMPVMDGVAAARQIRDLEAKAGRVPTPIIALTANAMEHHTKGYLAAGMNGLVVKPISAAQLFDAIDAAVRIEADDVSASA